MYNRSCNIRKIRYNIKCSVNLITQSPCGAGYALVMYEGGGIPQLPFLSLAVSTFFQLLQYLQLQTEIFQSIKCECLFNFFLLQMLSGLML